MNENTNTVQGGLAPTSTSGMEPPRTLEVVAAEIRTFTASMLNNIIEIGRRMCEAKAMLPYGKFGDWIKENTGYSRSTANNFMRLFEEYGSRQGSLFGATLEDVQTFGQLTYTQALALLALPSGEREEFVEAHDMEHMSTRELQAAIEERNKAQKELEDTKQLYNTAKAEVDEVEGKLNAANARVKELEGRPPEVRQDQEAIDKAVAEAVEKANAAHAAELNKLKASEERKRKKLEKQIAEAEKTAKDAEEKAAEAGKETSEETEALRAEAEKQKAEADRLRRELALSGEATVTFKLYFSAWQKDYANMMNALEKADNETAGKLKAAVNAQIDGWRNA